MTKDRRRMRKKYAEFYEDDKRFGAKHTNLDLTQYGKGGDQPLQQFFFKVILDKIAECVPESAMVLDVGCGQGQVLVKVAPKAKDIVGVELAPTRIKESIARIGRYKVKNTPLVLSDALDLCFRDETFDMVIASEIIEHVISDRRLLQECYRVLKSEGLLIITTPNAFNLYNILRAITSSMKRKHTKIIGEFPELLLKNQHVRAFNQNALKGRLEETDLTVIDLDGVGFLTLAPERFWAKLFKRSETLKDVTLIFFTKLSQLFPHFSSILFVEAKKLS